MMTITTMQKAIHADAVEHGWWDNPNTSTIPEKLAMIHSEVSEALEDYRNGKMTTRHVGKKAKPCGFPTELADVMIRVMDLAEQLSISLDAVIADKMAYNVMRPYRHGNKRC